MERFVFSFDHPYVQRSKFLDSHGHTVIPEFDFVVVGGGPSGCALATRLYESGKYSVLLIERGPISSQNPPLDNAVQHPLQTRTLHGSPFDYSYETTSSESSEDNNRGQKLNPTHNIIANSGNVLGGSSKINFGIWTLGSRSDYDLLAEETGNDGFTWDNVIPLFNKVRGVLQPRSIPSSRNSTWSKVAAHSLACAGFKELGDINSGDALGYGVMQETVNGCGRVCATRYFDELAKKVSLKSSANGSSDDPAFEIWTSLTVERVEIEQGSSSACPRAIGVKTTLGSVKARHEVILTAGAIASPHILLFDGTWDKEPDGTSKAHNLSLQSLSLAVTSSPSLIYTTFLLSVERGLLTRLSSRSGVGPSATLAQAGIPVIHDSPKVGQGLWEHPYVDVSVKLREEYRGNTIEDLATLGTAIPHMKEWAVSESGLMSGLPLEWMAYASSKDEIDRNINAESLSQLERRVLHRDPAPHVEHFIHYGHGLTPASDASSSSYISITNVLLTPLSRGYVTLGTSRQADIPLNPPVLPAPRVVLNTMKESLDRDLMVRALRKAYEVFLGPVWSKFVEPPGEEWRGTSDQDFLKAIEKRVSTLWHFGGTCAMKTRNTEGVVDNQFHVLGVSNLRVADTSVLPFPMSAHTQSVAYLLGEKVSEIILADIHPCCVPVTVRDAEDGLTIRNPYILDAQRPNGTVVCLKRVVYSTHPYEVEIATFLGSEELKKDPRNHCVPILKVLHPLDDTECAILVMPRLRPCVSPRFDTFGEVVSFMRQIFVGLDFIHEHNIAHRDCKDGNIMMDAYPMYPYGFHQMRPWSNSTYTGPAKHVTRSQCRVPPKYYFIDFGISCRFTEEEMKNPITLPILGGDKSVPEFQDIWVSGRMLYNPFPTDVYFVGNLIRREFINSERRGPIIGFEPFHPLIADMTQEDPTKRPTMPEVVARFEEITATLSSWKLRSQILGEKDHWFRVFYRTVGHWRRRIGFVMTRTPPVPVPK